MRTKVASSEEYLVPAVEAAGRILEFIARSDYGVALSAIAQGLDLNKASCSRILRTLRAAGLVHFNEETKRYLLGSYLFVLGTRCAEQLDLLGIVVPVLREAAREIGITCAAIQRYGSSEAIYVAKAEPPGSTSISVSIGHPMPLIAGSHGKCFLAYLPASEAKSLIEAKRLVQFTPLTQTSLKDYLAELATVNRRGYAVSHDEHVMGIGGVSVPIFDPAGHVALVMAGISTSVDLRKNASRIAGQLRKYATSVSQQLTGTRPA